MPVMRRPATSVVVLQWPCGNPICKHSPLVQRPWLRIMLAALNVSLTKARRSGSGSVCASNQSPRWLGMSGLSCFEHMRRILLHAMSRHGKKR